MGSTQSEQGQYEEDNDHQADEVDDTVHDKVSLVRVGLVVNGPARRLVPCKGA